MTIRIAAAAGLSLFAALAMTRFVIRFAPRFGLLDAPNLRSSHTRPTPRVGGVAVLAGAAVGIAAMAISGVLPGSRLTILLFGALAMGAIGLVDDVRSLPALARLVVQIMVAFGISIALGGITRLPLPSPLNLPTGLLAVPLGALWLAAVTNFYNFMDGIDGLAAGQAAASCVGIAIAAWSADVQWFAILLSVSALGFLVLNWPPAKVFLGDVGSTSIGFTIAGLALVAGPSQRPGAVFAVAVGLALFLLDPLESLVRLSRTGHRIGTPHRTHSYQVLARAYKSHATVTATLVVAGLVLSSAGALAYRMPALGWPVVALAAAAFAVERYLAGQAAPSAT